MRKPANIVTGIGVLLAATSLIAATDICAHEHHERFSAGERGDPKKPARVVNVKMFEGDGKMGYEPARIECVGGNKSVSFCKTTARRITNSSSGRPWKIANMRKS